MATKGLDKSPVIGLELHKSSIDLLELLVITRRVGWHLDPAMILVGWTPVQKSLKEIWGTSPYAGFLLVVEPLGQVVTVVESGS